MIAGLVWLVCGVFEIVKYTEVLEVLFNVVAPSVIFVVLVPGDVLTIEVTPNDKVLLLGDLG